MLQIYILFLLIIYTICEICKYQKTFILATKGIKEKLYNKPVVIVKLVDIILLYIFVMINRFTQGVVEKSSGIRGLLTISIAIFLFIGISIFDFYRVKKGHNDKIIKKYGLKEEDFS